jgi:hypothetical protein
LDAATVTVDAARSCSSADGGKRILSPERLCVLRDVGATLYGEDQLKETDSVAML